MSTNTHFSVALTSVVVVAASAFAQTSFDPAVAIPTPERPDGVASADFNGDGEADLAVTVDNAPDQIRILLGNGNGTFTPGVPILTGPGSGPASIVSGDFDGDEDPDIAVVLNNINTLRIYTNTGGVFAAGASASLGAEPRRLQGADMDNDGDMDFATANRDGNSVTIVTYQAGVLSSVDVPVGDEPRGVAIGDFNGDGQGDLAVSRRNLRDVGVFMNTGAGFATPSSLPVHPITRPDGLVTGDLDGDGDTDIAVAVSDDVLNQITIFSNTAGAFAPTANLPAGGLQPDTIRLADFDGNGRLDLAVSLQDSNTVNVFENTVSGYVAVGPMAAGTRPGDLTTGDFNGDGMPDLAVASRDSNTTEVMLNTTPPACGPDVNNDGAVTIADLLHFLDGYFAGDPSADLSGDGAVTISDLLQFLQGWFAGCA